MKVGRPSKPKEHKQAVSRKTSKTYYDKHLKGKEKSQEEKKLHAAKQRESRLRQMTKTTPHLFAVVQPQKIARNPTQRLTSSGVVRCLLEGLAKDGLYIKSGARILDATGPASTTSKQNNLEVILREHGCSVWCNDLFLPAHSNHDATNELAMESIYESAFGTPGKWTHVISSGPYGLLCKEPDIIWRCNKLATGFSVWKSKCDSLVNFLTKPDRHYPIEYTYGPNGSYESRKDRPIFRECWFVWFPKE
jgi:hypothetical protein